MRRLRARRSSAIHRYATKRDRGQSLLCPRRTRYATSVRARSKSRLACVFITSLCCGSALGSCFDGSCDGATRAEQCMSSSNSLPDATAGQCASADLHEKEYAVEHRCIFVICAPGSGADSKFCHKEDAEQLAMVHGRAVGFESPGVDVVCTPDESVDESCCWLVAIHEISCIP